MRVLLIDDDARLAELLVGYLQPQGVALVHAGGGQAGLAQLQAGGFDAILLDVMMPGMDGLAVLRRIRDAGHRVPVLMLTARGDEADRVVGLELGADDYVAKPFSPRELLARLRAVLRRAAPDTMSEKLTAAGITIDTGSREAWVDGKSVELTGLEIDLLTVLLRRAGRVVPRSALLELAGRADVTVGDRAVDVHISRLRKKLGDDAAARIRTVRGVGYVLARATDEQDPLMTRTTIRIGTTADTTLDDMLDDGVLDYSKLRVIMGSTERRGAWPVPRHLDVRVLLGSVELDLRNAQLAPGVTTIDIDVTLGSVELIIPPDLLVEVGMLATAASVDETTGFQPVDPARPILRVVGDATLASCEIVRRAA